ncbi:GTPase activating protein [Tulasnella sp. JGI-2019a]|nr:GTPase activating protein [Tulasnella sp. JGI-2019a]
MGGGPSGSLATPSSFGDQISTHSVDSMVEIVQHSPEHPETTKKHQLVYSKSKVYVHPTAFSRDNIPGFVAIVKKDAFIPTYLLSWIPESLLNEKGDSEWEKFYRVEGSASTSQDDEDGVIIDAPPPRGESYAFSVPLTSIYSFMVTAPTLSCWYGSITVNLTSGATLSTLHFHDDESRSMQISRSSPNAATWGGEDLLQHLRAYCQLLKSMLQPHLFLVDPSKADIEAHSTVIYEDLDFKNSSSPIPIHRRPRSSASEGQSGPSSRTSVLHDSLMTSSSAGMAVLSAFSQLTQATRHAAQSVLSHPLAKPIIPHLPEPVRSLVNAPGEWSSWVEKGGLGEFESARVYLAKWARIVAEEGERARQREAQGTARVTGTEEEETSDLGVFELLAETSNLPPPKPTRDPKHPIDKQLWDSWFDIEGRPTVRWMEVKKQVFRRGVSVDLKRKVWPFILGVVPWESSTAEREQLWAEKQARYEAVKAQWRDNEELFNSPEIVEERHRIDVDCRRTDRTHPLFATLPSDSALPLSPTSISVPGDDSGGHTPANRHVETLSVILLTYHIYEKELGYVQGMSDLLSPIYVVCGGDEVESFWCFVKTMERMNRNFLRDQSGMKKQLLTLQQLLRMMDPELYKHFEKTDSLNLFFCFRWILIWFKREFVFDDVIKLWDCLWTDYYSTQFVLFVALAVLESHRDVILRYLVEFDEVLKYCNELSMTIDLDSTLAQAEVLFLSFAQIVADIDRRQAEQATPGGGSFEIRRRKGKGKGKADAAGDLVTVALPSVSDELRELIR